MKDRVEDVLLCASEEELSSVEFLVDTINDVLEEMKTDRRMLRNLLRSFPTRLDLMKAAEGKSHSRVLNGIVDISGIRKISKFEIILSPQNIR